MSPEANKVLTEALALPSSERARLAASLIDSLDEDEEDAVDALWRAEVLRRADDLDAGRVTTVEWDEVRRSLRR